ncbi:ejaculatory bulb-specific protein 3-like [Neodiprion virginianus]|uniref:ejaculatory bulb-specific protein 3-like n=1 Tax=Neodiprion fabricii TaxID=2872261 RepID=UPI001ED98429|nr:ejaculatory bulb-specific protein 3-like [Neodiprion fabricii]XP_046618771.1 ejaculatory bulb-specific protein 3-like [Neodiprion virginianus]
MKGGVIFLTLFTLVFANNYSSKYDNVDVDRILSNDRILTNYIRCLMEEGPCTAEGRELKKTLPDALSSECSKCNEKQKSTAEKVIEHLRVKRPRDWDKLTAKYDPRGEYKKRYEASIAAKKA